MPSLREREQPAEGAGRSRICLEAVASAGLVLTRADRPEWPRGGATRCGTPELFRTQLV